MRSPTVLRYGGYRVRIYLNDHPPAHVHVSGAGMEARVTLEPVRVVDNWGFNHRQLAQIVRIIQEHRVALLAEWNRHHRER
ncbi:MAG: DUF4160 domain-containing protein [Chloroflexota bacterium]